MRKWGKVVGTEVSIVTLVISRFVLLSFQKVNLALVFLYLCCYKFEVNIGLLQFFSVFKMHLDLYY